MLLWFSFSHCICNHGPMFFWIYARATLKCHSYFVIHCSRARTTENVICVLENGYCFGMKSVPGAKTRADIKENCLQFHVDVYSCTSNLSEYGSI